MEKIIAMIPIRKGSKRIPNKGLTKIKGKSLLQYAVDLAKKNGFISEIYVNSNWKEVLDEAKKLGVKTYKRKNKLCENNTIPEDFVADFMKKKHCDYLVTINPTAPLLEPNDLNNAIQYMLTAGYDTVHTVEAIQSQCVYPHYNENNVAINGPINFNPNKPWGRTQDMKPIYKITFGFMIWKTKTFLKNYEKNKTGYYGGTVYLWRLPRERAIDIDYPIDLKLAEFFLNNKEATK